MSPIKRSISLVLLVLFHIVLGAPAKSTTWNGSTWSNGTPDWSKDFITIASGTFNVAGGVDPGSITVQSGATLNITGTGVTTEIKNGSTLTVEGGGSLNVDGSIQFSNGSIIDIQAGTPDGSMDIGENLINNNNSDDVTFDGNVNVDGNVTNGTGGDIGGTGTFTVTGTVTNNGTIGGSTGNDTGTLPIELTDFQANSSESGIRIHWTSATEINNEFYSLERSYDGSDWVSVIELPGAGNSSEPITYEFFDLPPAYGRIYYRLTQTDYDGTSETFPFITVLFENPEDDRVKVFPSLVTPEVQQIQISNIWGEVLTQEIVMYDLQGRLSRVNVSSIDPTYIAIDVDRTLKGGLYILKGQVNGAVFSERIVIRQ